MPIHARGLGYMAANNESSCTRLTSIAIGVNEINGDTVTRDMSLIIIVENVTCHVTSHHAPLFARNRKAKAFRQ